MPVSLFVESDSHCWLVCTYYYSLFKTLLIFLQLLLYLLDESTLLFQTDRQTDRQTDIQAERKAGSCAVLKQENRKIVGNGKSLVFNDFGIIKKKIV